MIPSDPRPNDWRSFCVPDRLAFRAACNAVVEASSRPVKPRVIARLSASLEAHVLFAEIWEYKHDRPPNAPEGFFDALIRSHSWKTLVIETIARETAWRDLFKGELPKKILDRLHNLLEKTRIPAILEKTMDGESHPVAKIAVSLAATLATLSAVHYRFPETYNAITAPIRAIFIGDLTSLPVTFAPQLDETTQRPIPVRFELSGSQAQIPVTLTVASDGKPVQVRFVGDREGGSSPSDALNNVAAHLAATTR